MASPQTHVGSNPHGRGRVPVPFPSPAGFCDSVKTVIQDEREEDMWAVSEHHRDGLQAMEAPQRPCRMFLRACSCSLGCDEYHYCLISTAIVDVSLWSAAMHG